MNRNSLCKYLIEHGEDWLSLASASDKELKKMAYRIAVLTKDTAVRKALTEPCLSVVSSNRQIRHLTPIDYECARDTH